MNRLLTICFVLLFFIGAAQNQQNSGVNGVKADQPASRQGKNAGTPGRVNSMVTSLQHDTCLGKKFSIVFYTFQDSSAAETLTNVPLFTNTVVPNMITLLNNTFKKICVSFESCSTVVIPNYRYGQWDNQIEGIVVNNYYTENTINIYVPKLIGYTTCSQDYAYVYGIPLSNPRFINMVVSSGASFTLLHAMGHFFGLRHTYDEINPLTGNPAPDPHIISRELVDRIPSNCYTHGDGFCDTDADPGAQGPNTDKKHHQFCDYTGGGVDFNGEYYTPPADNYMSYYRCACRFSQEQYNYMARIIAAKRMYLH